MSAPIEWASQRCRCAVAVVSHELHWGWCSSYSANRRSYPPQDSWECARGAGASWTQTTHGRIEHLHYNVGDFSRIHGCLITSNKPRALGQDLWASPGTYRLWSRHPGIYHQYMPFRRSLWYLRLSSCSFDTALQEIKRLKKKTKNITLRIDVCPLGLADQPGKNELAMKTREFMGHTARCIVRSGNADRKT